MHSPSLPRLQRIDDISGSSSGWWAVQDLPGAVIYRQTGGSWSFYFYPAAFQEPNPMPKSWLSEDSLVRVQKLLEETNLQTQSFATRKDALQALQAAREILD